MPAQSGAQRARHRCAFPQLRLPPLPQCRAQSDRAHGAPELLPPTRAGGPHVQLCSHHQGTMAIATTRAKTTCRCHCHHPCPLTRGAWRAMATPKSAASSAGLRCAAVMRSSPWQRWCVSGARMLALSASSWPQQDDQLHRRRCKGPVSRLPVASGGRRCAQAAIGRAQALPRSQLRCVQEVL